MPMDLTDQIDAENESLFPTKNFDNVLVTASTHLGDLVYNMFYIIASQKRRNEQLTYSLSQVYIDIINDFVISLGTRVGKIELCANMHEYFKKYLGVDSWDSFLTVFLENFVQRKYFITLTTAEKTEYVTSILTSVMNTFADMVVNKPNANGESRLRLVIDKRTRENLDTFIDEIRELLLLERDNLNQQFLLVASQTTVKKSDTEFKLRKLISLQKAKITSLEKQVEDLKGALEFIKTQVQSPAPQTLTQQPQTWQTPREGDESKSVAQLVQPSQSIQPVQFVQPVKPAPEDHMSQSAQPDESSIWSRSGDDPFVVDVEDVADDVDGDDHKSEEEFNLQKL